MSKSIDKPLGTAVGTKEMLMFNPTTGQMEKITLSSLSTFFGGGGGGDVTAPTVVSAIVTTANQVVVVFSESVTVTTAGWSFRRNAANWAITSVSGSGTTWTFLMATSAVSGETLDRSYNSATGSTTDSSSNELVSFTNSAVTNSVAGTGLPHTSNFTASNNTLLTAYTPDAGNTWSAITGVLDIQTNKVTWDTLAASIAGASVEIGASQCTITCLMTRLTGTATYGSLYFRYTDANNWGKVALNDNIVYVYQTVAGVLTTLFTSSAISGLGDGNEKTIVIVVGSNVVDVTINGVSIVTGQATNAALTGTKLGIEMYDPTPTASSIVFNSFAATT